MQITKIKQNKKGIELTFNTIVILIILIIVMITMIIFFVKYYSSNSEGMISIGDTAINMSKNYK